MKMLKKYSITIIIQFILLLLISCTYNPYELGKPKQTNKIFKANYELDNKGRFITANGELKTLIIYAVFSDDHKTKSGSWNFSTSELPAWSKSMINKSTNLNFPNENLTQYFYEMSDGKFMLYGDIYPTVVVPKYPQKEYKSIADVNYEILTQLDGEIDFSKYDNWSKGKDGKFINKPDGKVDAIYIVYRNFENRLFFNNGWTGSAHFYLTKNINTNDDVTITTGRLDKGSGIQTRGGKNGFTYLKYVLAHEFGHLLLGAGHIENVTNLALMTGGPVWNASRGMHSWEKNKLGWLEYIDIPKTKNSSIKLADYHTRGIAFRIELSNDEWFVLENHQNLSRHDYANDKGLFIYHITNASRNFPTINLECADGNWNFEIDKKNELLTKTSPNPLGKSEMNFKKTVNRKSYSCYKQVYGKKSAWGDKYDAFDPAYNSVFSPVSNPPSKNKNKKDFIITVNEISGSDIIAEIFFKDIYQQTSPSKPQITQVTNIKNGSYLNWLTNNEPDLKGYNIYIADKKSKKLEKKSFIAAKQENGIVKWNLSTLASNKNENIILCLTALDHSGKESLFSNYIVLTYNSFTRNWKWERQEEI